MTKPSNIESIEKATQRSWNEWLGWFDEQNLKELSHKEIAEKVHAELDGKIDSPGWWSQGVTVAYEQHIGRRAPGQRADGTFEVSVNKNFDGSREEIFARVRDWADGKADFDGHKFMSARTSVTPVRSYWRCDFADGTKLDVAVGPRSDGDFMVTISHTKLRSSEDAEHWRSYWKQEIATL